LELCSFVTQFLSHLITESPNNSSLSQVTTCTNLELASWFLETGSGANRLERSCNSYYLLKAVPKQKVLARTKSAIPPAVFSSIPVVFWSRSLSAVLLTKNGHNKFYQEKRCISILCLFKTITIRRTNSLNLATYTKVGVQILKPRTLGARQVQDDMTDFITV